ncbi:MAG: DUF4340 domain-containing protein [Deltaproteobacteria bacterium]|nr:DUF4340 domain-containing protein [Deltaproteobacteria bacterium]
MRRFRGTLAALLVLVVVLTLYGWSMRPHPPAPDPAPTLLQVQPGELASIRIVGSAGEVVLVQEEGTWRIAGAAWPPSRRMLRRMLHQLQSLEARALVAEEADDLSRYGLGEEAVRVELVLVDGRTEAFEVGDPNPVGVSYYLRPLPGRTVYTVQKASVDFYGLSVDAFRERRFAAFDPKAARLLDARVDGMRLELRRVGERQWAMTRPRPLAAEWDEVRTLLGRAAGVQATRFVEDDPVDPGRYGIAADSDRVFVALDGDRTITVWVGKVVPGTEPPERYALHEEHNTLYAVRADFLDIFRRDPAQLRRRTLIAAYPWDVEGMWYQRGDHALRVARGPAGWHREDGTPIPGATPDRVARAATELTAVAFHDDARPIEPTGGELVLVLADGARTVTLGDSVPSGDQARRYVMVDGDPVVYEVEDTLGSVLEDLIREVPGREGQK